MSALLCFSIGRYVLASGVMLHEAAILALVTLTFLWLTFLVNRAILGALRATYLRPGSTTRSIHCVSADIALIIPVYNKAPWDVFGNASATLKDLIRGADGNRYALFVLSDTAAPESAAQEERAFAALRVELGDAVGVYYRRLQNTDKKIGNIADWVENWGAAYEGMVVLNADSLMSAAAIRRLSHALISDPDAGLVQSHPLLIGARTLFGRVQQFSNAVYGRLMAEGMASWSQSEGNYWGHIAIIRTQGRDRGPDQVIGIVCEIHPVWSGPQNARALHQCKTGIAERAP